MNHQEALQLDAVDKYLLHELPSQLRDDFEEHYFDCQECSTDLRATAAFIDAAKKRLAARAFEEASGQYIESRTERPRPVILWRSVAMALALAASLLVIIYQNALVLPHFRTEIAQLDSATAIPAVSLVGANSRGEDKPKVAIEKGGRFLLSVDIPTDPRFLSYRCLLSSPAGGLLWTVEISSQMAKDTVTMSSPAGTRDPGIYTLLVQGREASGVQTDIAHYHFEVTTH